ncbi:hypothetical protein [Streptomyces sp. NPDC050504]|uniref:hypothetical protein n=1 Tax=Streptomyces sp. NPDC050504 TaxID=3365618 RepID=UPI003796BAB3
MSEAPQEEERAQQGPDAADQDSGDAKETVQRQPAWAARRDLIDHAPDFMGGLVEGNQYGVAGGVVHGDLNFHLGGTGAPAVVAGPVDPGTVDELAEVFSECPSFAEALAKLREDRVVILVGGHGSGRRAAALMLLRRLGANAVRQLDDGITPASLPEALDASPGTVACNLAISRSRPLRQAHLLDVRERLRRHRGLLVITVEPSALLAELPSVRWEPPPAEVVLASHTRHLVGEAAWEALRPLAPVAEFLSRTRLPDETRRFAKQLAAHHRGEINEARLGEFVGSALADQVEHWLTSAAIELRDKAFLISLAVFNRAPYAITAELGDSLFVELQKTANPHEPPRIPIFGSSLTSRLSLARAEGFVRDEMTEWGPVPLHAASFEEERAAEALLQNVWNVHPSARTALVRWLRQLAVDRRPLVRTRAAAAAAVLVDADLPSAMAHLIEPWATDGSHGNWLAAANALALSTLLKVPAVRRILHDWCTSSHSARRLTAVRVFGLLGATEPEKSLDTLLEAVRQDRDGPEETELLAEATQLLLLSARSPVLSRLVPLLGDGWVMCNHALRAFALACGEYEEGTGRPLVLQWFTEALHDPEAPEDGFVVALWRAALSGRTHTDRALGTLLDWIRVAERDEQTASALVVFLPALVTGPTDLLRLDHLLRTAREADSGLLTVTQRLRAALAPVEEPERSRA